MEAGRGDAGLFVKKGTADHQVQLAGDGEQKPLGVLDVDPRYLQLRMPSLTIKQKILIVLLEKGPLQNSDIAKRVSITEQWCSETINALHAEGLIESQFITPRRINKLTSKGVEVAKRLKEISQSMIEESVKQF